MEKALGWRDLHLIKRKSASHKGDNGRLLAVGGSIDYVGAILLAGMAAYRSGVDLVVIAAPEKIAIAINAWPDFVTEKFRGAYFSERNAGRIARESRGFDALLVGNGIGLRAGTKKFARRLVAGCGCKKIIDADAIKSIRLQDVKNSVITPHRREFQILMENSGVNASNEKRAISAARKLIGNNVILLKGKTDVIISKGRVAFNTTGNPGMTKAGTGDVLAGLCAGLAAQGNELFESACAAAYINGYAGDLLYRDYGYGFTATDLADKIGCVMKRWQ